MTTVAGAMKVPTACQDHPVALTTTNASLETGAMALALVDLITLTVEYLLHCVYDYPSFPYSALHSAWNDMTSFCLQLWIYTLDKSNSQHRLYMYNIYYVSLSKTRSILSVYVCMEEGLSKEL